MGEEVIENIKGSNRSIGITRDSLGEFCTLPPAPIEAIEKPGTI